MGRRQGRRKRAPTGAGHGPAPEQALAQARRCLDAGDPRKALEVLRRIRQDGAPASLPLWLFCACVERGRHLRRKGLAKEAAAMRSLAAQHRRAVAVAALAADDLTRFLRCLDGGDAAQVYAACLARREPLPAAERAVADRLVIDRRWDGIEAFAADHPLRRDAAAVRHGVEAMDRGEWEDAARRLAGVPRRSPFAPWRLFGKAMGCFAAGDQDGLRRAVALLPEDFALRGTVAELRRCVTGAGPGGAAAVRRALGTDEPPVASAAASLRQALHTGVDDGEIERRMVDLADAVYPEDPTQARIDLLMIACSATVADLLPMALFDRVAVGILPDHHARIVVAQARILVQELPDGAEFDPGATADFLHRIPQAFPRSADRPLARSCVLESLAHAGVRSGIGPHLLRSDADAVKALTDLLGARPSDPWTMLVDLLQASLAADPGSPAAYDLLLDVLSRYPAGAAGAARDVLADLAERYPEDPEPCLEIAYMDYTRNAYRRVEAVVAEARRRAPYDERILDLQAMGLLRSADQSCKRRRFALAERDLDRAADLRRVRLDPILRVKRLLFDVLRGGGDAARTAAPHLRELTPAQQLRTLAVAIHDLEGSVDVAGIDPSKAAALRHALGRRAGAIERLAADEALALIAELPSDYRMLYRERHVAPVLEEWWPAVMARLDGDRLFTGFDTLLTCGGQPEVRAELKRRLRGGAAPHDLLLRFYDAALRFQDGEDYDSRRFAVILRQVDAGERQRMRAAATRLAQVVDDPLRDALEHFDFGLLDPVR